MHDDTVDLRRDPTTDMRWPVPAAARAGDPGLPPDPFEPPRGISRPPAGQVAWYAVWHRALAGAVIVALVGCVAFVLGAMFGAWLFATGVVKGWWL